MATSFIIAAPNFGHKFLIKCANHLDFEVPARWGQCRKGSMNFYSVHKTSVSNQLHTLAALKLRESLQYLLHRRLHKTHGLEHIVIIYQLQYWLHKQLSSTPSVMNDWYVGSSMNCVYLQLFISAAIIIAHFNWKPCLQHSSGYKIHVFAHLNLWM